MSPAIVVPVPEPLTNESVSSFPHAGSDRQTDRSKKDTSRAAQPRQWLYRSCWVAAAYGNLATQGQANFREPTPGCLVFGVWVKSGCLVLVGLVLVGVLVLVLDEEHDAGPVDFHAVDGLAVMLGSLAGCQRILA